FVDSDARALRRIEQNLKLCGLSDRHVIIRGRLGLRLAEQLGGAQADPELRRRVGTSLLPASATFDLAVLDPPCGAPDLAAAFAAARPLVARAGVPVRGQGCGRPAVP